MSKIPTYILAPNFQYTDNPNKPWLGRIIRDPLDPTSIIDNASVLNASDIETVPEAENTYSRLKGHSLDASLWATFWQLASGKFSASISREASVSYTMSGMDTKYLDPVPTSDDIAKRMDVNPRIRAAMNAGLFGRKPVYMISGIKIAKNLVLTVSKTKATSASVEGKTPIAPDGEVTAGAELSGSRQSEVSDSSKSLVDVIFAYELRLVAEAGWSKKLEIKKYVSSHGFLGTEKGEEEEEIFEVVEASKEDFDAAEFQDGSEQFASSVLESVSESQGGEVQRCVYLVAEE